MAEFPTNGERKALLEFRAKCEQAFTPFAPIDLPEFFAGRTEAVRRVEAEIAAPGRHVAIFGERGVGKTSLAQLASFFLRRSEEETHFIRCERSSTFDTIFADVLTSAGIEALLEGVESESQRQGGLNVPGSFMPGLSMGGLKRVKRSYRRVAAGTRLTGKFLLDQIGQQNGLVILDEYDRVQDAETHTRTAELIKLFSDARASTKIMLVGVAETLTQLIGEHASLSRSLAQIKLDRMSDDELNDIIVRGSEYLGVTLLEPIARRIVLLADGFPYFVHLLCLYACRRGAEEWFERSGPQRITEEHYQRGLQDALENAEHSLPEQYNRAIVTTRRKSDMFVLLLGALAMANERDVQVRDIARNLSLLTGEAAPPPSAFSWHLGELVDAARGGVLSKVRDGYYKFANPLMRPYVRFRLEYFNWIDRGGQLEFPFMKPVSHR